MWFHEISLSRTSGRVSSESVFKHKIKQSKWKSQDVHAMQSGLGLTRPRLCSGRGRLHAFEQPSMPAASLPQAFHRLWNVESAKGFPGQEVRRKTSELLTKGGTGHVTAQPGSWWRLSSFAGHCGTNTHAWMEAALGARQREEPRVLFQTFLRRKSGPVPQRSTVRDMLGIICAFGKFLRPKRPVACHGHYGFRRSPTRCQRWASASRR